MRTWPVSIPALRRRLVAWSALLLCAGSCLNPQPDPFPQVANDAPAAEIGPFNPAEPTSAAGNGESSARAAADNASPAPEQAPPALAGPVPPPAPSGGDLDAGAPPPVDGGPPDATPPDNGAL